MTSTLAAALARAIRAERNRVGMTQEELGERLGWSRQTVTKIELGERQVAAHELVELCTVLDVGLMDLLSRADPRDRAALRI